MPPTVVLVLASASPARLRLLRAAGIEPEVVVSDVDEDAVTARLGTDDPDALVAALAAAKAQDVAASRLPSRRPVLVIGCDTLFTVHGETWGKPSSANEARARIRGMREDEGVLRTGHQLVDPGTGRMASGVAATTVRFGPMSDAEVDAYVATGEPLAVAGSFTLDGRSAPFVDGVEGDHTNVVGLSLPMLRRLLAELGHSVTDLWSGV
ncbi:nucleoside triphosphate pyrophosphatase [Iamia sp.]|uniref:nucleoside triphosphate pyrophosphatase n=1 Tax=Iamia sp. TaxID=2722710 RepID=UPI002CF8CECF|nr:nucleoside triphosphate pyrophosphatase [Iamia sp.]HXH59230.1 nucleoside triphosphate pyrophosphatase [Iamia sp.]